MPKDLILTSARLVLAASLFAAAPYGLSYDPASGLIALEKSLAMARDGNRGGGDDNGGDDDHGRGGDDDRDDDHSGGDDDDDDDNGGSDDRGGRGRGGDDDRGRGGDDDGDDDHSGRNDDGDDRGRGQARGRGDDDDSGIEVTLSDGSRIEIEDGRFERKDAAGRTIEERPATRRDYARLQQAGTASGGGRIGPNGSIRGGGTVAKLETNGRNIEVTYSDGWKEEIEAGRYELKDASGRTVIQRPARPSDRARLFAAAR